MDSSSGFSFFKIVTIALYAMALFGIVTLIIQSSIKWYQTGDYNPFIDSTLGQIVAWDNQIGKDVASLKDPAFASTIPEEYRAQYKSFVARDIVFYLMLFFVLIYLLFKIGKWIMGYMNQNPGTDILIVLVIIIIVIPFLEFLYGKLMNQNIIPYKGLFELFKPSTLKMLFDGIGGI